MQYYKISIVYPNGEEEEINEDFYALNKAIEYANHILGQVQYNAAFHARSKDGDGDILDIEPYCLIKEIKDSGTEVVFDTRKN